MALLGSQGIVSGKMYSCHLFPYSRLEKKKHLTVESNQGPLTNQVTLHVYMYMPSHYLDVLVTILILVPPVCDICRLQMADCRLWVGCKPKNLPWVERGEGYLLICI